MNRQPGVATEAGSPNESEYYVSPADKSAFGGGAGTVDHGSTDGDFMTGDDQQRDPWSRGSNPRTLGSHPQPINAPEVYNTHRDSSAPEAFWYPGLILSAGGEKETPPAAAEAETKLESREKGRRRIAPCGSLASLWRRRPWAVVLVLLGISIVVGSVVTCIYVVLTSKAAQASSGGGGGGGGGGGSPNVSGTAGTGSHNGSATAADTGSGPWPGSACRGEICPQILAAVLSPADANASGSAATRLLHVFARGSEGQMLRRSMDPAAFSVSRSSSPPGPGGWVEADWQPMGGPEGSSALFKSQPAATALQYANGEQHVGVFAVSASGDAAAAWLSSGKWSSWAKFGERMASPLAVCASRGRDKEERAEVFALAPSAQGFLHAQTATTAGSGSPKLSSWDQSLSDGYPSSTVPAVVCRQSGQDQTPLYDLLYAHKTAVYQTSFVAQNNTWSPAATVQPAHFAGDPVVVAPRDDQLAFFGLGVNGQFWTSNWTKAAGWNNFRSIGGAGFQSMPTVVNTGSTIEVIGLGSDDRLKHRRLKDGQWSNAPGEAGGWEDLAVYGHSAPAAVYVGGPDRLMALMVVGRGRQLNVTVFPLPNDGLWTPRAVWRSAGGNFSTSFMEVGAE